MANFEKAINVVLGHEGGYANNPHDPGGATNFGLSQRTIQGHDEFDDNGDGYISADEVKNITPDEAKSYYKNTWWDRYGYDRINNNDVATKLFDMAVNMGQKAAVKLMQKSCNVIIKPKYLAEDGILGPMTINAINDSRANRLLGLYRFNCAAYYRKLVEKNPRLSEFNTGWQNRAFS